MKFNSHQRLALAWAGVAVLVFAALWTLAPVLAPFIVAAGLAYALSPAVDRLVAWRVPRVLAVLLLEVALIIFVLALLLLVVPVMAKELPQLRDQIPVLAQSLDRNLSPWLREHGIDVSLDPASIKAFVLHYVDANVEDWFGTALNSARIGGSIALTVIGNAVLMPVVLFYLLQDWHSLKTRIWHVVPLRVRPGVSSFLKECDAVLGQYLRGQALVMLVLAFYYSVALAVCGFELALPIGIFTGLAVCVPYVGFGLGLMLALLAGMLQFGNLYGLLAVAGVFGLGQLLESFFLTPQLVGERIGLSPLMVIFALLVFGHLFGFVGVLVALPVSAVLVVAERRIRAAYMKSPLYLS